MLLIKKWLVKSWQPIPISLGISCIVAAWFLGYDNLYLIGTVILTLALLWMNSNGTIPIIKPLLENKGMVFLGKMSFSIYMWHQLVLAFVRYGFIEKISWWQNFSIACLIVAISYMTFRWIETPFRDESKIGTRKCYFILGAAFLSVNLVAGFVYLKGGVIKDVPELDITYGDAYRNMHLDFNTRHIGLKSKFNDNTKSNVVIVGNSFTRDWINVMMASSYADKCSYYYETSLKKNKTLLQRLRKADAIFITSIKKKAIAKFFTKHNLDFSKIYYIGIKNYGVNNALFYNANRDANYCHQKLTLSPKVIQQHKKEKKQWGDQYIDLIGLVKNESNEIAVFTNDCKFISQDCKHFTPAGAEYYAGLIEVGEYGVGKLVGRE